MIKCYGLNGAENLTLDFPTLKTKRDAVVARLNGIYGNMLSSANVTHIQGWGKFIDAHTIDVDGTHYTGEHVLIATGSKPVDVKFPGGELCCNSDDFFNWEEQPKKVIVLGGGYIGTELG